MSDITEECPKGTGPTELNADTVARFLAKNMDFFERHPGLLRNLRIPHETGQSISLIERQVVALRRENNGIKEKLQTLMANGRENERLFDKVQTLITELLEQESVEQIRQTLEQSIQQDFGACYCRLWLIAQMPDVRQQQLGETQLKELIHIIRNKQPYLGELKKEEYQLIFRDCPKRMKSVAVISLSEKNDGLNGVLAIGHTTKDHYQDDMSTELLEFIGKVTARLIGRIYRQRRRNKISHTP